jgi:hypothetical protein
MRNLAIINGEYGERHVENIIKHQPANWNTDIWQAPTNFPLIIDYPEDYIPDELPNADLVLSFGEHRGIAELIPDIVKNVGAKAVIAAIDNEAWLPRGLARQLRGWLEKMNVVCATPKPLCSLTEYDYGVTRKERLRYDSQYISEFAKYFGQPDFKIKVDPDTRTITSTSVNRDAVCGCARFVSKQLIGISADEAEEKSGLLHHHYPCLASMGIDSDFGDTLMHISGNVLKDNVGNKVKPFKTVRYIDPGISSG